MDENLYPMIFKWKSFHLFKNIGSISQQELSQIEDFFRKCKPLTPEIPVEMKIVPAADTTCKRGQEYCILLYSENREGYLPNIGYIGQQLDLMLASMNIGSLWFGIGRTEVRSESELTFVIMLAIAKVEETAFRKDMFKSKRKPLEEIWVGEYYRSIAQIARFSPSACNTQPWIVESGEQELKVYRYQKPGKRGIMPADKVSWYDRIDIGIFFLFLEVCMEHEGLAFERTLLADSREEEKTLVAVYAVKEKRPIGA